MKIYLIGMPGSGKSTLGKKLALNINYQFIDLDKYIIDKYQMPINEIFEKYGEDYFRGLETICLRDIKDRDNVVVSCGGGIIVKKDNKRLMNGLKVYLDVQLEEIKKRLLKSHTTRPLLKDVSIGKLYQSRKDSYEYFADITIENIDLKEALKRIIKEVEL